jgi:hypothetical protein
MKLEGGHFLRWSNTPGFHKFDGMIIKHKKLYVLL